jgi:hypothetical protein
LEGYTPPSFVSQSMPTTLVFQGPANSDNTLVLNLATLPHNADGSSAVKTVVFHGGQGGFNTLKVAGGKFEKESYHATGPHDGVLLYDDMKVIFTDLTPVVDTTWGGDYYFDGPSYNGEDTPHDNAIAVGDGQDVDDWAYGGPAQGMVWQTFHTLRIYDPTPGDGGYGDFEEATLANKSAIHIVTHGNNSSVRLEYTRGADYLWTGFGATSAVEVDAAAGDSTAVDARALTSSPSNVALTLAGNLTYQDAYAAATFSGGALV